MIAILRDDLLIATMVLRLSAPVLLVLTIMANSSHSLEQGGVPCKAKEFRCTNEVCKHEAFWCDGQDDCGDNSDEVDCTPGKCESFQFRCDNGRCVLKDKVCDGQYDCEDKSDELNCTATTLNSTEQTKCESSFFFSCDDNDSPKCHSTTVKCDGHSDCEDGFDEQNCECVGEKNFKCENSDDCIAIEKKCDEKEDCKDGSDERKCDADV